jgi:hypothetical protein
MKTGCHRSPRRIAGEEIKFISRTMLVHGNEKKLFFEKYI